VSDPIGAMIHVFVSTTGRMIVSPEILGLGAIITPPGILVGWMIVSPETRGDVWYVPQEFVLWAGTNGLAGATGATYVLRKTLRNGDTILEARPSCTPGFANISTLPTLMTPSTHVSIMVDFCIFIKKKKTRYKKEKHEWREEHPFKSGLCYPIISWLSKFMIWHITYLCWLKINLLFSKPAKALSVLKIFRVKW
jgi:hypothetical protein